MNKNLKTLSTVILVTGLLTIVGCAHSTMRGSVAMKAGDDEAHVCMGDKEVKGGDRVALFKNDCKGVRSGGKAGPSAYCEKVKIGEGTVERPLNGHYSIVKVDPGVSFEEGTIVEKE